MKLKTFVLVTLSATPLLTHAALGPIVITPSSYEQNVKDTITPITVITEQTIKNSGATNISDLLRGQAGINVRDLFGDGQQATIDLRGFGPNASNSTLVLVNGRKLNNSTDSAAPDLSTINLDDIKQIEILQGSAGVLYGNQAIGGVINIILNNIEQNSSTVTAHLGSYNRKSVGVNIKRNFGRTSLSISAKKKSADNYRDNNDAENEYFSLSVKHIHDSFIAYVDLTKTNDYTDTPGALLESELDNDRAQSIAFYSNDYFDTTTDALRVGIEKHLNETDYFDISFNNRVTDRDFLQSFRPTAATVVTTQDRDSKGVDAKYSLSLNDSIYTPKIIFGLNYEDNDYKLVSSFGPQPIKQSITAFYISSDFFIDNQSTINIGLRNSQQKANNNSNNLDDDQTVLSATYSWTNNKIKSYVRADQNFRFPTVEEHTNTGFGNPVGLKTQTGTSYEVGTEIRVEDDRYRTTLYQINLENEIAYDGSLFANLNLNDTTRNGLILEANNIWSTNLSTQLSLTFIEAETTGGPYKNKSIPLVPEKVLRLSSSYKINNNLLTQFELIHVGEQFLGGDFDNALAVLDSYDIVNANIKYSRKKWNFSFRINNLLNKEYSETGNQYTDYSLFPTVTNVPSYFTAPERNFWLTTQYTF